MALPQFGGPRLTHQEHIRERFQRSIKWIMLVSGILPCATAYVLFAPAESLRSAFGLPIPSSDGTHRCETLGRPDRTVGLMLIYGAFKEPVRRMVLLATSAGKSIFILVILSQGQQFLRSQAGPGVVIDSVTVLIFAAYLILARDGSLLSVRDSGGRECSRFR
jgi:hypothetical protein